MFGGITVHGSKQGKELGFPTANLECRPKDVKIKEGIYAAYAILNNNKYKAGLVVRLLPFKVEVYLIDYSGRDFYGSYLEVEPIQKVSELEKYETMEELSQKIKVDLKIIENFFS